ncbi:MAG: hypothetical protein HYX32_00065 [Actinobacteria bacterium]|nr:hypothetical protein [Actinomycetota bacterium]
MPIVDLDALPVVPTNEVFRYPGCAVAGAADKDGRWFAIAADGGRVSLFDRGGQHQVEWPLPTDFLGTAHSASIDLRSMTLAVTGAEAVRIYDLDREEIRTVGHPRWRDWCGGSAAFDPTAADGGRLWIARPLDEPLGQVQPSAGVLGLVDARTGAVVEDHELNDSWPESFKLYQAPHRGLVLGGSYGQDGSRVWFVRRVDSSTVLRAAGWTEIVCAIDPSSGELLYAPHNGQDVEVRTWWNNDLVVRSRGDAWFGTLDEQDELLESVEGPDGFEPPGAFIDDRRLIVSSRSDRLLVIERSSGAVIGQLQVSDADDGHWSRVHQLAPGSLLLVNSAGLSLVIDVLT